MKSIALLVAALLAWSTVVTAQVPNLLNYQGRVAVGTVNFDGSGQFKFALVNANGSTTYWSNDGTSTAGSQPTAGVALTVTKGLYSVMLGNVGMTTIPATVWTNADVRLRVWFNDGTNGFQLLTPDQRLAPNGYIPAGSVSSSAIADGAVSAAKIATGSITGLQLGSGLTLGGTTAGTFSGPLAGNVTGNVSGSAASFTGSLAGNVTGTQSATVVATVGGVTAANVASGANLANAATSANTASTLVKRDASGNFTAGTITANGSALTSLNASNISTGTLADARLSANIPLLNASNTFVNSLNVGSTFSAPWRPLNSGTGNLFVGSASGNLNTTGTQNTAVGGEGTLSKNVTGSQNSAFGALSMNENTTGGYNTGLGMNSLRFSNGDYNTASGFEALASNTIGNNNTALGSRALRNSQTGANNIAIGMEAGLQLTTGSNNIVIGNPGVAGESNIIRLGTPGLQTATYLSGTVTLPVGSATLAPLKLQTGVNLTTPLFGAVEFDGTNLYLTNNSGTPTRKTLAFTDSTISAAQIGNGTITSAMLANGSVTSAQLAAGAVGSTQLAAGAVAAPVSVAGTTQTAAANTSYVATGASPTTFTLPTTANVGDVVNVTGAGAGGWSVAAGPGQAVITPWIAHSTDPNNASTTRNWASVACSADGSKLAAVVLGGQIYTSSDSGVRWTARESSRSWASVASSADGSKLVAVVWGFGQIYTSTDSGANWTERGSYRIWRSVASSADGSKLVAAAIDGQIYTSTDSGVSWTARESNRTWFSVACSADGSKLAAVVLGGQIYTSTDFGVSWTAHESNRNWYSVASSADGSKLVAAVYEGQIYTSTDSGVSWTARESERYWGSVASSADGGKLAAVVLGGQIYTSTDSGMSWTARESNRQWVSAASSADGSKLVAVVSGGQIYTSAMGGTQGTVATLQYLGNDQWAAVGQTQIAVGAVGSTQIAAGAVGQTQIAVGAVDSTQLAAGALAAPVSVAGTTQTAVANTSYLATSASPTTFTLPTTANVGDVVNVTGAGPGGWSVAAGSGQAVITPWIARESNRDWQSVASSADGSKLVAVASNGQIYTSTNSGLSWTARESSRYWYSVASSADGSKLVGIVLYGQIYTSTDSGVNWTVRESTRTWQSVASSADGSKLAAVEYGGQIYTSTDSGVSWTAHESNRYWASVASSADGSKLVAVAFGGRIYTSTDSGVNWTARESSRNWYCVASSADGSKLVSTVENGQIYTSTDSGVNWTARESNRTWQPVTSSVDGSKLTAAVKGGQIYTSTDSGVNWTARESNRDWRSVASSADGSKLVAVPVGGQIYTSTIVSGTQGSVATLQYLGSGQWSAVGQTQIAAGAVGNTQIASGAVGSAQLASGLTLGGTTSFGGSVGIGTSTPFGALEISREGNLSTVITSTNYSNGFVPMFIGRRARGTEAAPEAVAAGNTLASFAGRGHTGTDFTSGSSNDAAAVTMHAAENFAPTANGTDMRFWTTPLGTTDSVERMRITSSGNVGIGGLPTGGNLEVVTGGQTTIAVTANGTGSTPFPCVNLRRSNGTPTAPTAVLTGDTLGLVGASGHTGSAYPAYRAFMVMHAVENFSPSAQGTQMSFFTTPTGSTSSAPRMVISSNGTVGIGTSSPTQGKFQVDGGASWAGGGSNIGYLAAGTVTASAGNGPGTISIYASHRIWGQEIIASSDARIKQIIGRSNAEADLKAIMAIEVTDYRYKDVVSRGDRVQKKVIAQQVEKIFPLAVSKQTDVVPDIYQKASIEHGWVNLKTDLKKGERVRLTDDETTEVCEVLEVKEGKFRTAFKPVGDKVFVYGREVKDFRAVDYEAISMLNVSATQHIKKEKDAEVKALQEENAALKQQLAVQEKQLATQADALKQQAAKDKAIEARLAALEQGNPAATGKATQVALKK